MISTRKERRKSLPKNLKRKNLSSKTEKEKLIASFKSSVKILTPTLTILSLKANLKPKIVLCYDARNPVNLQASITFPHLTSRPGIGPTPYLNTRLSQDYLNHDARSAKVKQCNLMAKAIA